MTGRQRQVVRQMNSEARSGTRIRTQKEFPDFVNFTCSESEQVDLIPIPKFPSANSTQVRGGRSRGRGVRGGRGGCGTKRKNTAKDSQDRYGDENDNLDEISPPTNKLQRLSGNKSFNYKKVLPINLFITIMNTQKKREILNHITCQIWLMQFHFLIKILLI